MNKKITVFFIGSVAATILIFNNYPIKQNIDDNGTILSIEAEAFNIDNPSVNLGEIIEVVSLKNKEDIAVEVIEENIEAVNDSTVEDGDIIIAEVETSIPDLEEHNSDIESPSSGVISQKEIAKSNSSRDLNNYVLNVIKTYEIGRYPYLLNNDYENYNGVTENLYYQGELLLKAEPNGSMASNCTGITFEVFFKAMQQRNKALGLSPDDFNGLTKDELFDMALTWFVAKGPKTQSNLAVAVEKYNFGTKLTNLEDLLPGDFIDFNRENNTGHAGIFLNWIREGNKIIGFRYWSSQGSTNGIGYNEEYFNITNSNGEKYGNVIIDNLNMARVTLK